MRILITGGVGFLGSALTDILQHTNYEVRVYDSLIYEEQYRKPVPFVFGDVRDKEKFKEQLDWADVCVHLAALVGDGACALNPLVATEVNYEAVEFLANNFNGRVINLSSCSVYGASDGILTEDSPTNPLSLYASMKLKTEALFENKNAITFRLGTLFGLGDSYSRVRLDLVLNTLTAKAVTEHALKVFGGDQYRPLLHVRDAAQTIANNLDTPFTGIYNLNLENIKILTLAERIQKYIPDTDIDVVETTFEDSRNYKVSSQKAIEGIGFKPRLSITDGIIEVRNLLQEHRVKDINNPRYSNVGFLGANRG
jgi:nucleoside-diphosphate-sugar epimerase